MKKLIYLFILVAIAGGAFYLGSVSLSATYFLFGHQGFHQLMTAHRDHGIMMAKANGDYRCCINPPCTMCYMEGNKWNYGIAGTCACDDFIAKGEEPCPQCAKALDCSSEEASVNQSEADVHGNGIFCPTNFKDEADG